MMLVVIVDFCILALFEYTLIQNLGIKSTIHKGLLNALKWIDITVTVIYIIEACIKIIVYGLVIHERSYLKTGWNMIDIIIILSG